MHGLVSSPTSSYNPQMGMRRSINWGVFAIFGVVIAGFIIAGFLVSSKAETDDGHPLNIFFWGMAGMFLLTNGGILAWVILSNKRRGRIEKTWLDAEATILELSETGTYINNQPRIAFKLHVNSPVHPPCDITHKQVIPLTALAQFQQGATIRIKVNPENPEDIQFL
ncbi:MAG: hypothetical protein KAQ97_09890 [Candidatus Fermentibacteraceae bacterium]|nr:hypothetical protein [Candidatus Fermentibacteraceae bacterium]